MDAVLGVSMAPASIRMVLLEGENADGPTIEEDGFEIAADGQTAEAPTVSAPDRVIAGILGTREGAADAGLELSSIGVSWTDQHEAAVLREALAARRIGNVMLVSAFLAATALAQSVGGAAAAKLGELVAGLDESEPAACGLFVVGSGVDIAPLRLALEAATSLARGAALAAANAPLVASSTAALAYAQDAGTGAVDVRGLPDYLGLSKVRAGDDLAYSAVPDLDAEASTSVIEDLFAPEAGQPRRRAALLIGSGLAVAGISAALALEIALAIGVRTTVALQPTPGQRLIVPTQQAPAPLQAVAPRPYISVP